MERYLEIGIVYPMIYPISNKGDNLKNIDKMSKDKFFSILEIGKVEKGIESKILDSINNSKMKVVYSIIGDLITKKLNLNSLNDEIRKKSVEFVKIELLNAKKYNAKYLTIISGEFMEEKVSTHMNLLEQSLLEIIDYSKKIDGPVVLLEAFDSKIDKKVLIGSNKLAKELFEKINQEKIGLLVDLSHIPMLNEDIEETIYELGKYIKHVHIGNTVLNKESFLYGDLHPRFGHEDGENDTAEIKRFLKSLIKIGYINKKKKATLSFEVKPYEDEESEVIIANCKRSLRRAWLDCLKEGELI